MAESVSYSDIRKDWKEFVAARKMQLRVTKLSMDRLR